jgi:FkbM family methyltransferase
MIANIFRRLQIVHPSYLDIGAHHPSIISNTCYFYKRGSRGVNIEPDPYLYKRFTYKRRRDINLNIGIGSNDNEPADFYVMSKRVLNTFSKEDAEIARLNRNCKIKEVIKIKLLSIDSVLKSYFPENAPDFISIDAEGLDLEILKGIDFSRYRPKVFCVETLIYHQDKTTSKNTEVMQLMQDNGYFAHDDTFINTVFVDQSYLSLLK